VFNSSLESTARCNCSLWSSDSGLRVWKFMKMDETAIASLHPPKLLDKKNRKTYDTRSTCRPTSRLLNSNGFTWFAVWLGNIMDRVSSGLLHIGNRLCLMKRAQLRAKLENCWTANDNSYSLYTDVPISQNQCKHVCFARGPRGNSRSSPDTLSRLRREQVPSPAPNWRQRRVNSRAFGARHNAYIWCVIFILRENVPHRYWTLSSVPGVD